MLEDLLSATSEKEQANHAWRELPGGRTPKDHALPEHVSL